MVVLPKVLRCWHNRPRRQAFGYLFDNSRLPDSFRSNYLKWVFAMDSCGYSPYVSQVSQSVLPSAPYNETHFHNPRYLSLYNEANATIDKAKRCEVIHEMQVIDFNEGGYIIPMFNNFLNIMAPKVNGFPRGGTGIPLGNASWEQAWLA